MCISNGDSKPMKASPPNGALKDNMPLQLGVTKRKRRDGLNSDYSFDLYLQECKPRLASKLSPGKRITKKRPNRSGLESARTKSLSAQ